MLTIEKGPTLLQKYGVFVAAFTIGLITSLGALHTIDPKNNATVAQTSETHPTKEVEEAPKKPTPPSQSPDDNDTATRLVQPQPAYQAPSPRKTTSSEPAGMAPTTSSTADEETTNEMAPANDGGLFSLPIVELILFRDGDQNK